MINRGKKFLPALMAWPVLAMLAALDPQTAHAPSFFQSRSLVVYDAGSGAIPAAPLMGFLDVPQNTALLTFAEGATVLDTTPAGSGTYAGWVTTAAASAGFPILDRTEGFQVNFTLRVEDETHATSHRSGFSFIVLGADAKGIELAFWEDQIWAQGDDRSGGLFTRAESVAFATTQAADYQVTIVGDSYMLSANRQPILSGPLRDYSAFSGFPDPYETPNFLFFGDNTTSAQARIRLSFVSVSAAESVVPTASGTATDTPLPAASSTPLPGATPSPVPIPAGPAVPLCSSGWILLAGVLAAVAFRKIEAG